MNTYYGHTLPLKHVPMVKLTTDAISRGFIIGPAEYKACGQFIDTVNQSWLLKSERETVARMIREYETLHPEQKGS